MGDDDYIALHELVCAGTRGGVVGYSDSTAHKGIDGSDHVVSLSNEPGDDKDAYRSNEVAGTSVLLRL
jgi:hypothetical protein